jgi:hypothetical protein
VQVATLPPVEVRDVIWTDPDVTGIISARAGPISVGSTTRFGVHVAVHVALSDDEAAIRRVLVHEFGHCFFYDALATDAVDAGLTELNDIGKPDYTNDTADRP